MKPLTRLVLISALRHSNEWTLKWGDLKVSVNTPTFLLEQDDFVEQVQIAEKLWGESGITICLEILEGSFIGNSSSSFIILKKL